MAIDFPNSPVQGSTYSYLGIIYTYEDTGGGTGFWKVSTPGNTGIATSAEVDTGTNNGKYLTPLAIDGSKYGVAYDAAGTASTANTGTGANDVPTNADVRNPRNRIVNPSMAISQERGFGTQVVPVTGRTYFADQFNIFNDGATGAVMESSYHDIGGSKSIRLTATTASTNLTGSNEMGRFMTSLEKSNMSQLDNGDVVIAFKCRTNWTGKLSLAVRNGPDTRSYVTDIDVVSGINQVFKVIPFETDTISSEPLDNEVGLDIFIGLNNEGTHAQPAANNDAWQAGSLFCSDESTQWTKTINNFVEIANVDLYAGNVPREFQPNSYAQDLAECQRYGFNPLYDIVAIGDPAFGFGTASLAANKVKVSINLPPNFRVGPTFILNDFTSGDFVVSDGSNTAIAVSAVAMSNVSSNIMAVLILTTTVDPSNYRPYWIHRIAAGSASTFFSARL